MEEKSYWFVYYNIFSVYYSADGNDIIEIPGKNFLVHYARKMVKGKRLEMGVLIKNFIEVSKETYDEFNTPTN